LTTPVTSGLDDYYYLNRIIERSKRRTGLQLPPSFVRDQADQDPPLAQMLRGGQGGEVRLKLFLTMALLATDPPHKINPISSRVWASALTLPDPESRGARRISDALRWLNDHKPPFVSLDRIPGSPPTIQLLSASGSGKKWVRPTGQYVTVPLGFWTNKWIIKLSGAGTALLIVLLDLQGGRTRPLSLSGHDRRIRGLSDDTWTRATKELHGHGLLEVGKATQGTDLDWRRARNTYWVPLEQLEDLASHGETGTKTDRVRRGVAPDAAGGSERAAERDKWSELWTSAMKEGRFLFSGHQEPSCQNG
jgi:hypothetical protein